MTSAADRVELHRLTDDRAEQNNVAKDHPETLAELKRHAEAAHEPVEEGTFFNREIHERDRRAKFGNKPIPKKGAVNSIPTAGLIDRQALKIARVSSESNANQRRAANAIDGDPHTHWHTSFSPEVDKHPHELVIDLGSRREVSGIRYLARQDGGWNGALAKCEFFVGDSPDAFDESVATVTFRKMKTSQEKPWKPASGRYLLIRILSEVNAGPWASISELGIIGQ